MGVGGDEMPSEDFEIEKRKTVKKQIIRFYILIQSAV